MKTEHNGNLVVKGKVAADKLHPIKTFEVFGNYGTLTVCCSNGKVLSYKPEEGDEAAEYADIVAFNVAEYRQALGLAEADMAARSVDICDIGFTNDKGECFEPSYERRAADLGWFDMVKDEVTTQ